MEAAMIKVSDDGTVVIDGSANTIIKQAASVIVEVAKLISTEAKISDITQESIIKDINDVINVELLARKGMSVQEAIKVLGLEDKLLISKNEKEKNE